MVLPCFLIRSVSIPLSVQIPVISINKEHSVKLNAIDITEAGYPDIDQFYFVSKEGTPNLEMKTKGWGLRLSDRLFLRRAEVKLDLNDLNYQKPDDSEIEKLSSRFSQQKLLCVLFKVDKTLPVSVILFYLEKFKPDDFILMQLDEPAITNKILLRKINNPDKMQPYSSVNPYVIDLDINEKDNILNDNFYYTYRSEQWSLKDLRHHFCEGSDPNAGDVYIHIPDLNVPAAKLIALLDLLRSNPNYRVHWK